MILNLIERVVDRQRLFSSDMKSSPRNLVRLQCSNECVFDDETATRRIDDKQASLHLRELSVADKVTCCVDERTVC